MTFYAKCENADGSIATRAMKGISEEVVSKLLDELCSNWQFITEDEHTKLVEKRMKDLGLI